MDHNTLDRRNHELQEVKERLIVVETTQNIMREDFKDHEVHDNSRFKDLQERIDKFHLDVGRKFDLVNEKLDKQGKNLTLILGGLILASWIIPLLIDMFKGG